MGSESEQKMFTKAKQVHIWGMGDSNSSKQILEANNTDIFVNGDRARRALTSPSAARAPSRLASSRLLRLGSLRTDHRGALTWRLRQGALGVVWASVARDGTERTRVCNISCRPVKK